MQGNDFGNGATNSATQRNNDTCPLLPVDSLDASDDISRLELLFNSALNELFNTVRPFLLPLSISYLIGLLVALLQRMSRVAIEVNNRSSGSV
jgi:hypothetical protein